MYKFNQLAGHILSEVTRAPKKLKWKRINKGIYQADRFELYYNDEQRVWNLTEDGEWWESFQTLRLGKVYAEFINRDGETTEFIKWRNENYR